MHKTALSFYVQQNVLICSGDRSLEWLLCSLPLACPSWGSLTEEGLSLFISLGHPGGSSLPLEEEPLLLDILSCPPSPCGPSFGSFLLLGYEIVHFHLYTTRLGELGNVRWKRWAEASCHLCLGMCCIPQVPEFSCCLINNALALSCGIMVKASVILDQTVSNPWDNPQKGEGWSTVPQ